jgi:hypothetical protein
MQFFKSYSIKKSFGDFPPTPSQQNLWHFIKTVVIENACTKSLETLGNKWHIGSTYPQSFIKISCVVQKWQKNKMRN